MQCIRSVTRVGLWLSSSTVCRTIQNISERTELRYWVCVWALLKRIALLLCFKYFLTSLINQQDSFNFVKQKQHANPWCSKLVFSAGCECVLQWERPKSHEDALWVHCFVISNESVLSATLFCIKASNARMRAPL